MRTWAELVGEKPAQIDITTESGEKYTGIDLRVRTHDNGLNTYMFAQVSCESWAGSIYPQYDGMQLYLLTKSVHEGLKNLEGTIEKVEVSW